MPKVSVTVITKNEAADLAAALESVRWADEIVVVDSESRDDTVAIARRFTDRVVVEPWRGYIGQKNFAASLASHDWVFSLDADERVTPELAGAIGAALANPQHTAYRLTRVTWHLGRWLRSTDWYPDYQTRLYDRRHAGWTGTYVHEAVTVNGSVGELQGELQHFAYRDISDHLETIDRYTTLAARQMFEDGRRAGAMQLAGHAPLAFLRNYLVRGGIRDGLPGLIVSSMNAYYVFLKFAKLWQLQTAETRRQADAAVGRSPIQPKAPPPATDARMFSLHIDTAQSWRGGQNQVLLTVNGLRAIGQRAALVAHPNGELRRRAQEGLELIPIASRSEIDLSAGWRLARALKRLQPDIIHAHDPHGVAMASLALSMRSGASADAPLPRLVVSRRVDFRLKGNSFSRWKYRQADMFLAASEAIRRMLVGDGVPEEKTVTVHEGIDIEHVEAAPPVNIHEALFLPHHAPIVGNVGALVPHKGQRYLIEAAHLVIQQIPDARFVILGEGELREHLVRLVHEHRLEKHVFLPGFRTDVLGCIKAFDLFVMSSVTEGLGTSLLDAMACRKAIVATNTGGIPEVVANGRNGVLVEPRDHRALATAIIRLLSDHALRQRMADAGDALVRERFTVERMVAETARVYGRLVGRRRAADTVRPSAGG